VLKLIGPVIILEIVGPDRILEIVGPALKASSFIYMFQEFIAVKTTTN
jgi:hypothetical protein